MSSAHQRVHELLEELELREKVSLADATAAVCRLPLDAETLDALVSRARERGSRWLAPLEQAVSYRRQTLELREGAANGVPGESPPTLEGLLASPARSTIKVRALVQASKAGDRESAGTVRRLIGSETNPFVLATMASVLGRAGDATDALRLEPLLEHEDQRVVANSLQALYLLRVDIETERLVEMANRPDARVRANALAMLARTDPDLVLERVADLLASPDDATRARIAYLLGEMPGHPRVLARLFAMLAREERAGVLKQIAQSLKKHAEPKTAESVIGPLWELQGTLSGGKLALVKMLLQEIGVELGLVEAQVAATGERFAARHAPKPPAPVSPAAPRPIPVEPGVDGDVPLSFHEAWGAPANPPSSGAKRSAPVEVAPPPAPPAKAWPGFAALAAAGLVAVAWLAGGSGERPAATEVPRSAQIQQAARPKMRTHLPEERGPAASSAAGDAAPLYQEPDVAERLGPVGAQVDLEGTIAGVAPGRAIVACNGRYYVVRGEGLDKRAPGERIRCRGRIAGVAANGLIFLEGAS